MLQVFSGEHHYASHPMLAFATQILSEDGRRGAQFRMGDDISIRLNDSMRSNYQLSTVGQNGRP